MNHTYSWRVLPNYSTQVNHERALRLASIGEHVDPNPRCDLAKYDPAMQRVREQQAAAVGTA